MTGAPVANLTTTQGGKCTRQHTKSTPDSQERLLHTDIRTYQAYWQLAPFLCKGLLSNCETCAAFMHVRTHVQWAQKSSHVLVAFTCDCYNHLQSLEYVQYACY